MANPGTSGGLGGRGGSFGFGGLILDGGILGPLIFLSGTAIMFHGMGGLLLVVLEDILRQGGWNSLFA